MHFSTCSILTANLFYASLILFFSPLFLLYWSTWETGFTAGARNTGSGFTIVLCVCLCSVRWCVSRSWSWKRRRGVCRLQRPDWGESGRERGSWQKASAERETGNRASQAPGPPQPFRPSPITPSSTTVRHAHTHKQSFSRCLLSSAPFYFLSLCWLSLSHTFHLSCNVCRIRCLLTFVLLAGCLFMHFTHPLSFCPISWNIP